MLRRISQLAVIMGLMSGLGHAQLANNSPNENDMYCSGVIRTQAVPRDTYVISGEESDQNIIYHYGQWVFINKGAKQGVKVGDEFLVSREDSDPQLQIQWVKWQAAIVHAMGQYYADLGTLRVVNVQQNTSSAEIVHECSYIQRGDIVLPFTPRAAPQYKPQAKFDQFAAPSGKSKAMIAEVMHFGVLTGAGHIAYVNLGAKQGVQVGNYFRIFRYQDNHHDTVYEIPQADYMTYGFGSAPKAYGWADLPRDVLGEAIVLRVGENASTILVTDSVRDIYIGDYVELE